MTAAPASEDAFANQVVTHTLDVLVDNEPGSLARVVGLFSGRGYNIDSLNVAEVDRQAHLSRITLVCSGKRMVIEQIKAQLSRLIPVRRVEDLTVAGKFVARELALVKVSPQDALYAEALKIGAACGARVAHETAIAVIFEMTGSSEELDDFVDQLIPLGHVTVSRTGSIAVLEG